MNVNITIKYIAPAITPCASGLKKTAVLFRADCCLYKSTTAGRVGTVTEHYTLLHFLIAIGNFAHIQSVQVSFKKNISNFRYEIVRGYPRHSRQKHIHG